MIATVIGIVVVVVGVVIGIAQSGKRTQKTNNVWAMVLILAGINV